MRIQRPFPPSFLLAAAVVLGCDHSSSCPQWMCAGQAAHEGSSTPAPTVAPSAVLDSKVILPLIAPPAKGAPKKVAHAHRGGGGGGGGRSVPSTDTPEPERPKDRGLANGVDCTFSSDCASGDCTFGKCEGKGGEKALGNGVACTFSSDCASGDCTFGKCAAKGGEAALGNGVACTFSSDCASGDCTFGVCKGRDD
jgi:hypothetical protein